MTMMRIHSHLFLRVIARASCARTFCAKTGLANADDTTSAATPRSLSLVMVFSVVVGRKIKRRLTELSAGFRAGCRT
jgi:hypothetical protein